MASIQIMRTFSVIVFVFLHIFQDGECRLVARRTKTSPWNQFVSALNAPLDMREFLLDSYRQMGDVDCTTVIWDQSSAAMIGSVTFCLPGDPSCAYKYMIRYDVEEESTEFSALKNYQTSELFAAEETNDFGAMCTWVKNRLITIVVHAGGNVSEKLVTALKAGYQERCGAYILLIKDSMAITQLLHSGDDSRIINTGARFLIWYQQKSLVFENDEVWKKIPNVILFNTTLNSRTHRLSFTILEMLWPMKPPKENAESKPRLQAVDFWRHGKGLKNALGWYRDKTTDLQNITLKILVVEHPPGVIKILLKDNSTAYAGIEVDIVNQLKEIMNFNTEFVDADSEMKWGGQLGSNTTKHFYGAVARLIYGETDMAIGSFFVLKHYLDFIDMSIPLDVACTSFLTPLPLARPRYLALILPFNFRLWIVVTVICFILAPLGLYSLTKIKYFRNEYPTFSSRQDVVLTSFRLMCQVALHIWPKYWPVRMFIGWYWLFTLLITLAYRGAMVAFLTIPLYEAPIDNLNQLYSSGLRIGGWGTELQRLFTQHQPDKEEGPVKKALSEKYEVIEDLDNGISMVSAGKFALYENIRFLKFIRQTRNLTKAGGPSMRVMPHCVVPVHIAIAYQKNSPICSTINRHIRRFRESGLTNKWGARLVQQTKSQSRILSGISGVSSDEGEDLDGDDGETKKSSQRKQRVLTMADLQGSVYLILFGVFMSLCAFGVELFLAHAKEATLNVNKELKKIVVKTVKNDSTKKEIFEEGFRAELEAQFKHSKQLRLRKTSTTNKNKSNSKVKTVLRKQQQIKPPFPYVE